MLASRLSLKNGSKKHWKKRCMFPIYKCFSTSGYFTSWIKICTLASCFFSHNRPGFFSFLQQHNYVRPRNGMARWDQITIVLHHHIVVHLLWNRVEKFPLMLKELYGHTPECYWSIGLGFRPARADRSSGFPYEKKLREITHVLVFALLCLTSLKMGLPGHSAMNLPAMQETRVQCLGQEDTLEKGVATHASILARRILWTEKPGELQSMGSQRVRHSWATNAFTYFHFLYLI